MTSADDSKTDRTGGKADAREDMTEMESLSKPTVDYQGYKRTITDVLRIRKLEEGGDDQTEVSRLMEGIDDAIKTCRNLRRRLEKLHRRRNTGYYQQLVRRNNARRGSDTPPPHPRQQ